MQVVSFIEPPQPDVIEAILKRRNQISYQFLRND